ncbi:MAG: hypothetical protein Q9181_007869 [Wetmoreana brouardii]
MEHELQTWSVSAGQPLHKHPHLTQYDGDERDEYCPAAAAVAEISQIFLRVAHQQEEYGDVDDYNITRTATYYTAGDSAEHFGGINEQQAWQLQNVAKTGRDLLVEKHVE